MKKLLNLVYLFGLLPVASYGQCGLDCDPASSAIVLGGGEYSRECYLNSKMVSQNPSFVSTSMLEPCNFAITFIDMNRSNLAATHTNRGIIHVALGNYDDAFTNFNIGMNLLPETPEIFINRGNAFYRTGDYQMAIEDYSQSLELGFTNFSGVYLNLGKSYERIGNINLAEQNYRQALELLPDQEEAQNLLNGLLSQ